MSQEYLIDEETLLNIAKAIRKKTQTKDRITAGQFAEMILAIQAVNDYYLKEFAGDTIQTSIKVQELLGITNIEDFANISATIPLKKYPNETISGFSVIGLPVGTVSDSVSFVFNAGETVNE